MSNANVPLRQHFNAARLRSHTWDQLKLAAMALDKGQAKPAEVGALLKDLTTIELYWAYPGGETVKRLQRMLHDKEYRSLHQAVSHVVRNLVSGAFRSDPIAQADPLSGPHELVEDDEKPRQNYFEVLFVDELDDTEEEALKQKLRRCREHSDPFTYDPLVVRNVQDALIALLFNHNIQAVVVRYGVPYASNNHKGILREFTRAIDALDLSNRSQADMGPLLGRIIRWFRPEVDRYYVTDTPVTGLKDSTLQNFRRIFYRTEDLTELHMTIMRGIQEKFDTPFFTALKEYSKKPMGVFHAMPISRGNSVFKSRWIQDFGDFYGRNLFLAETSATTGGLDSLLQPTGPLKRAQELAARAFGAQQTFFATNGTSSSNKIVVQALVEPGDIVLIDRDCHKSHHYGMVLSGAYPVYLHSYPLPKYSMYGAVPLEHIREQLLLLRKGGRLDRVKMLLLTNSTFDGVVYNVERVMEQTLALKPDMVFLWDEAWWAFAGFSYILRQRTAMHVAAKLARKYRTEEYKEEYAAHIASLKKGEEPRLPDPARVRIRVYATQSTHKTLTSLRQGSMIHIWDEDFKKKSEAMFHEAYMTHTSTSANYQILASMDVGRRQVEFEGFELVEKAIELGLLLRRTIRENERLKKWFDIITISDLIPAEHRQSGIEGYYRRDKGWNDIELAWADDDFAVDPTKINLYTGKTGIDGDTFKNVYLMDKHAIQINKTSRNSVLFMTNIGTTRGSLAYLTKVLLQIAGELEERNAGFDHADKKMHLERIRSLVEEVPPLPNFSYFHTSFQALPGVPGGDLRAAYFLGYKEERCTHVRLHECLTTMRAGRELVSASFVIPYPPGFPVLVPGQVINKEIINFLIAIDVKEIHGYRAELGLRVFTDAALGKAENEHGDGWDEDASYTQSEREYSKIEEDEKVMSKKTTKAAPRKAKAPAVKRKSVKTQARKSARTIAPSKKVVKRPARPRAKARGDSRMLKGVSDVRRFFYRNEVPIYFISATNFNLLGADEWIKGFKFITYIDCFDGLHPNLMSPRTEEPHEEFQSIEDINNYLLVHSEVRDFIESRKKNAKAGKAMFLMFDEKTEALAKKAGLEVIFPSARMRTFMDNKVNTNRVAEKAGVPCVPYVLSPVKNYVHLLKVASKLGNDLVVQTPFGDSGHTTFFIKTAEEYAKYAQEIEAEKECKVMKRINCRGAAMEACVTRHGTIVAPLMTELVGFKELTPYKGGWCGNEIFADTFTPAIRRKARKYAQLFGDQLRKEGYKGYFELDYLIDQDDGHIYLGELNPRITGASSITNHAVFALSDAPLHLFHIMEWMNAPYELSVNALNRRWSKPENIDSWGQMVIKHTHDDIERVTEAPRSGIWRMRPDGSIYFWRMDTHRRYVENENEAFFLRITRVGDWLYEGADMGILVMRGRMMTDEFQLTERAKKWLAAIKAEYKSVVPGAHGANGHEHLLEIGGFKMM